MIYKSHYALLAMMLALFLSDLPEAQGADDTPVSFVADIQPIFARACTSCHGGVKQAGDISFVSPESILPPDGWVIEPGDPAESILLQRIVSIDPDDRMPPPHEHPDPLPQNEIDLIRRWIKAGAVWEDHWARAPLRNAKIEASDQARQWGKESLDLFVYQQLDREGLRPSDEAEATQWLRRVSFDLVGLPPTPEQISTFVDAIADCDDASDKETRYRVEAQRLLASPRFGERWAAMWMDLARYADSKGFEKDPHRDMWPYRDWLINAFNADMPYDEFTIKQLAGDLLPDAGFNDLIATAFHRNTQTNTEGGTDDEEYRIAAVIDRLSTTWTTWQATTFGCVQCHSHPYEPYDHEEFYAGLSMFNNSEDADLNSETPTIPYLSDPKQQNDFVRTQKRWIRRRQSLDAIGRQAVLQSAWQPLVVTNATSTSGKLGIVDKEIRVVAGTVAVGSTYTLDAVLPNGSSSLAALRITILPESNDPTQWPEQGSVLSMLKMKAISKAGKPRDVPLEIVVPDYRTGIDGLGESDCDEMLIKNKKGFGGYPKLFGPRWVVVAPLKSIDIASGEQLSLTIKQDADVTGGLSNHLRRFAVEFTSTDTISQLATSDDYLQKRNEAAELKKQLRSFIGTRIPVMFDRGNAAKRTTRMFLRGNWLERGEVVQPRIPNAFQPSDPADHVRVDNRLKFAQWLVSDKNPLASRVWVNRIWAELFGTGIVETLEDFGASGQPPSHPDLLDHLATKMQTDYKWSLKSLLESIVMSATYRQDSRADQSLRERDPRNRLFARGPRTRLTAEMVRDQALVAAGVLTNKTGGPSVMPPQPDGVWQQVYSSKRWDVAKNEDRFRRGVYTYWKRTSPYPGFIMFDTPSRDVCSPRRIATNTPLQALVTLNSEVYTELAGMIAKRCTSGQQTTPTDSIKEMFTRIVSRPPSDADVADLLTLYQSLESSSKTDSEDEAKPDDTRLSPLGIVALAILNSDWAITK